MTYAISFVKAHLLRLLDGFEQQREEIVITKRGKPIARIVPYREPGEWMNTPGSLKGSVVSEGDILTPLGEDDWEISL